MTRCSRGSNVSLSVALVKDSVVTSTSVLAALDWMLETKEVVEEEEEEEEGGGGGGGEEEMEEMWTDVRREATCRC